MNQTELQLFAENQNLLENNDGPPVPESFVKALTAIGGLNPHGEPNLRVVWGQRETKFAWGRWRIKYPAVFVNTQDTLGYDVLKSDGTSEFFARQEDIPAEYEKNIVLPRMKIRREEIGLPRFIIESWTSPDALGGEEEWNRNRWSFDEETRELVDSLGEFPRNGQYRHFFTVQTPDKNFAPLDEDVLTLIRATLRAQENVFKGMTLEEAVKKETEEILAKQKQAIAEIGDRMEQAFDTPRIAGNAMVGYTKGSE